MPKLPRNPVLTVNRFCALSQVKSDESNDRLEGGGFVVEREAPGPSLTLKLTPVAPGVSAYDVTSISAENKR